MKPLNTANLLQGVITNHKTCNLGGSLVVIRVKIVGPTEKMKYKMCGEFIKKKKKLQLPHFDASSFL